jgi:hypothetical protein
MELNGHLLPRRRLLDLADGTAAVPQTRGSPESGLLVSSHHEMRQSSSAHEVAHTEASER